MDFHNKEKSEATQRLERIDLLAQQLNSCNPNIAYFDKAVGKYVYDIKFSLIKTILEEITDLNTKELERDLDHRNKIQKFLLDPTKSIFKHTSEVSYYGKPKKFREIQVENLLELDNMLTLYKRFVKDLVSEKFKEELWGDTNEGEAIVE